MTPDPVPDYIAGLDLGQVSDFTALAVLERTRRDDPADLTRLDALRRRRDRAVTALRQGQTLHDLAAEEGVTPEQITELLGHTPLLLEVRPKQASYYAVRHLERFPLGTPYTAVGERLVQLFSLPPLAGSTLVVDRTGVGRGVYDQLKTLPLKAQLVPLTITAGHHAARDGEGYTVPKKDLCGTLQLLFQCRPQRIAVARGLPESDRLVKELLTFKVKITAAANETYEAWREGDHDDLVLAVAVAAWLGEREGARRSDWRCW